MNTKTKKLSTVSMVLCGMFAALVAIGAFIQIPVPYMDYFTLQFFFVLLAGLILGGNMQHLSGFGCSLLAYDLYPNQEVKKIAEYVPLETLLAESDVITLHTNATEENHHLLDAAAFAKMKPGVTIVNTARGKLIDSDALLAALESGQVGAAGLDVLENENGLYYYNRMGDVIPNPELAAFRAMPNVILTDHTAFYTYEDVKSMVRGVLESAAAFAEGSPTRHEVTNR